MDEDKIPIHIREAINSFTNKYEPAASIREADETIDAAELHDNFCQVLKLDRDELFLLLTREGFKTHYSESGFVWMLKHKL